MVVNAQRERTIETKRGPVNMASEAFSRAVERTVSHTNPVENGQALAIDQAPYQAHSLSFSIT